MASTFLSFVTLFHYVTLHNQTIHLHECVLHSLTYILGRRENYSAVQYTTEEFLAASFCAVTYLKTLNTRHAKWVKKKKRV